VLPVVLANTIVDPIAVVVHLIDAALTLAAVVDTWEKGRAVSATFRALRRVLLSVRFTATTFILELCLSA
jgi:hypothetical protein